MKLWTMSKKLIFLFCVLAILFLYRCPFYTVFGIPCLGCGMTRSLFAFLRGDMKASLAYHAMLIPTGICACLFIARKKHRKAILYIWCILMLAYYLVRFITHTNLSINTQAILIQILHKLL